MEHGQPKQYLMRPLFRGAEGWLGQSFAVPALSEQESRVDRNRIPLNGENGLLAMLAKVPDRRGRR